MSSLAHTHTHTHTLLFLLIFLMPNVVFVTHTTLAEFFPRGSSVNVLVRLQRRENDIQDPQGEKECCGRVAPDL